MSTPKLNGSLSLEGEAVSRTKNRGGWDFPVDETYQFLNDSGRRTIELKAAGDAEGGDTTTIDDLVADVILLKSPTVVVGQIVMVGDPDYTVDLPSISGTNMWSFGRVRSVTLTNPEPRAILVTYAALQTTE